MDDADAVPVDVKKICVGEAIKGLIVAVPRGSHAHQRGCILRRRMEERKKGKESSDCLLPCSNVSVSQSRSGEQEYFFEKGRLNRELLAHTGVCLLVYRTDFLSSTTIAKTQNFCGICSWAQARPSESR